MIHIYFSDNNRGPGKVADNLIKGFKLCNIEHSINTNLQNIASKDFVLCLQNISLISSFSGKNLFIGPNICTLPIDNNFMMSLNYEKTIVPSHWVKAKYLKWLPENKIIIWPVGIDTDCFKDFSKENKKKDFLIYFKRRSTTELDIICNFLSSKDKTFEILKYGEYNEENLIEKCKISKCAFIIDGTESQGIAVQEIMSCNLPLLVWDVDKWIDRGEQYQVPATSIPYWSDECGEKFILLNELKKKFDVFLKSIDNYNPRNYILKELNLEKQALEIINAFKH